MRHRSVQSRAACFTAMAVMAVAGFGVTAAQANLVLDLQVHGGGTATTVAPNSTVSLDVFAKVTGATSSADIQDAFFGVTNSGTIGDFIPNADNTGVTLVPAFKGIATDTTGVTTSTGGTIYGSAGSTAVGSTNSDSADGWVFARANTMQSVTPLGSSVLLGTLQFKVSDLAAAGSSASLAINTRTAGATGNNNLIVPALWQEDGTLHDSYNGNGVYAAGTGVTISVASSIIKGDMNGSGALDNEDINPFVLALTNRAAYQTQYPSINADIVGDMNNSGAMDNEDIAPFVAALTGAPGASGISLAAVPEPASIGVVGLVGLAALRRRRASR